MSKNCDPVIETLYGRCGCGGNANGHKRSGASCCEGSPTLGYKITYPCNSGGGSVDSASDNGNPLDSNIDLGNIGDISEGGGNSGTATSPLNISKIIELMEFYAREFNIFLNPDELDLLFKNQQLDVDIRNFIRKNNTSEAKNFAQQVIEALMSYTITNYPGLSEGLPYEWWNDDSVMENNSFFNQNPYNVWRRLTKKEKEIFKLYPAAAIILNRNKKIAEQQTIDFYGANGINDNSDAFRHAYFNALNSRDMGRWLAKKLSDAHESETPTVWSLEVQMDLFNNNIGHQAGHDFPNNNDIQMTNLIKDRINNGLGRYLDPVNYFDPNFWGNSLTGGLGTHGISSSTILKPTY